MTRHRRFPHPANAAKPRQPGIFAGTLPIFRLFFAALHTKQRVEFLTGTICEKQQALLPAEFYCAQQ